MGGTSLEKPSNIRRQSGRVRTHEQTNMIGLNSQRNHLPVILCHRFLDDLLQAITDGANSHFPASLRIPDDMVDKQMNRLRFMNVLLFHIDSRR